MRGVFLLRFLSLVLTCLASLTLAVRPALAQESPSRPRSIADSALGTAAVVANILQYTRWPTEHQPLQACLSRGSAEAASLRGQLAGTHGQRQIVVQDIEVDEPPPAHCDLIFFDGWSMNAQRQTLRALNQRPVLSLGLGPEFCTDGGMFCLQPQASGTRFEVNLDAVARSGLRVHPQVLRLARPRQGDRT
ncbi:MAG: YfiR family protein [Mitsuaria chitosanitabida]|uniref:YfiR family protein n=1 Tax=Roseateles chitosanitabidus TaxID=65048 RepID=UPI001B2DB888|nr:YfiR family protein [Roseateles chitosanitabidus]MBO9687531.1 YfiR family protein [Roseateles chitosanitabidus]